VELFKITGALYRTRVNSIAGILYTPNQAWHAYWFGSRCRKNYHRDNWLVATERPKRFGFLILRCRLFLS